MKRNPSNLHTNKLAALSLLALLAVPIPGHPASPDYDIVSCGTRESVRDTGFVTRMLVEEANFGGDELQIAEMYFPPGYRTSAHTHESEEVFYVIEGVFVRILANVNTDSGRT